MIPFEPRLFSFYVKLEFPAMGTILLIVFKFSISSTTNHFSVFFQNSRIGSLPSCMCIDSDWVVVVVTFSALYPWNLLLVVLHLLLYLFTQFLFHFVIHLGINIIKTCYKLCTLYAKLSCIFWLSVITDNKVNKSNMAYIAFYGKFSEQRRYSKV